MYLSALSCSIREDEDEVEMDEVGFLGLVGEDFVPSSRFRFKSSTYFDI
jgi:hypothetical protein